MNRRFLPLTPLVIALIASATYMAVLINLTWYGFLGLAVLGGSVVAAKAAPQKCAGLWKLGWVGTGLLVAGVLLEIKRIEFDQYHAALVGQLAVAMFLTAELLESGPKNNWKKLGMAWAFIASFVWLGVSYAENLRGEFYLGMLLALFLLVLCRVWFRPGAIGIQVVNTFILLLLLLPVTDFVLRLRLEYNLVSDPAKYYSYETAKTNFVAYMQWCDYYEEQWLRLKAQILEPGPGPDLPVQFRPGTQGYYFKSMVSINKKGFRGPEIPDEKGNTYRIVALGESTTFGITLTPAHRPWPEQLEQLIRERLKPSRPVEVINAGMPAANLRGNLSRLTNQILALKPDMIISYHGFNGFPMFKLNLARNVAAPRPRYEERPLKPLADLEYGLKMNSYKKSLLPNRANPPPPPPPMETDYAKCYQKLIQFAHANGIRLVLANYSMSVNAKSDPAIIDFYGQAQPEIHGDIAANEEHSEIVRELVKEDPELTFVDTHPNLDGEHQCFMDLVHFVPEGDRRMAEAFFTGISNVLMADLSGQTMEKPKGNRELENCVLDYDTPVDAALQSSLETIDTSLRAKYGMTTEQAAVGLMDLQKFRVAMIHPDRMEYAASIPKISILLAYFQLHPEAATNLSPQTRHVLGLMAKASNNEMAAKFSRELGLKPIEQVILAYHLYDTNHGGGIWIGKHYGQGDERIPDPLGGLSHAATVRQLLRYWLWLEQDRLVSPAASRTMREIFASPDIPHDDIKFVKGLDGRNLQIIRKWGSWEDWYHDSADITGPGRHYVLVALTKSPQGDEYLTDLAAAVDDLMGGKSPK